MVIVTYNSARFIDSLLDSLPGAADGLALDVVIVDNDSRDDTEQRVRRHGDARFVRSGGNLGYAAGINVGRRAAAQADSVLVLNPDLRLGRGAIRVLHEAVRTGDVGLAVPLLLEDGRVFPSLRREPSTLRSLGDALFGARLPRRPGALGEMVLDPAAYASAHDVDWATGAAVMVSARCDAAVGDWDERFFLYSEEVDYAARARDAGYRVRFVPEAVAEHHGAGSGTSPQLAALTAVSRLRYAAKRHGGQALPLSWVLLLGCALRWWRADQRYVARTLVDPSRWALLDPRNERLASPPPDRRRAVASAEATP